MKFIKSFLLVVPLLSALMVLLFLALGIVHGMDMIIGVCHTLMHWCIRSWATLTKFLSRDSQWLFIVIIFLSLGMARGIWHLVSQIYKVRRLVKQLDNTLIKNGMRTIHGSEVKIVDEARPFAFTVGFFRPVIYISKRLLETLSAEELRAVIIHEKYHKTNNHPRLLLAIDAIYNFLFFLPVIKNIVHYIYIELELRADRASLSSVSKHSLISAIVKIFEENKKPIPLGINISGFSTFGARTLYIIENKKPRLNISWHYAAISLAIFIFMIFNFTQPQPLYARDRVQTVTSAAPSAMEHCIKSFWSL